MDFSIVDVGKVCGCVRPGGPGERERPAAAREPQLRLPSLPSPAQAASQATLSYQQPGLIGQQREEAGETKQSSQSDFTDLTARPDSSTKKSKQEK